MMKSMKLIGFFKFMDVSTHATFPRGSLAPARPEIRQASERLGPRGIVKSKRQKCMTIILSSLYMFLEEEYNGIWTPMLPFTYLSKKIHKRAKFITSRSSVAIPTLFFKKLERSAFR